MLGGNSVSQTFRMLLTVSGSEEEAIFVAELRSSEVASGRHDAQAQQVQRGTSIHWTCTLLK